MRRALGASRGRIIRQLVVESLALAVLGGAAGLLVGSWGRNILLGMITAQDKTIVLTAARLAGPHFHNRDVDSHGSYLWIGSGSFRASRAELVPSREGRCRLHAGTRLSKFGILQFADCRSSRNIACPCFRCGALHTDSGQPRE